MANKSPGEIDWAIIPDVSYVHNDQMDIDPHLDEWEDVTEEELVSEDGHKPFKQMAALITYATHAPLLIRSLIQL